MRNVWLCSVALALLLAPAATVFAQDDFEEDFEQEQQPNAQPSRPQGSSPTTQGGANGAIGWGSGDNWNRAAAPVEDAPAPAASAATPNANDPYAPVATAEERQERAEGLRRHNTVGGAVGGFFIVDAASAPANTFRLQLETDFFSSSNFLNEGDSNGYVGGALSASYSILNYLEAYLSIASTANSNNTETPTLFQTLGDTTLGVKGYRRVLPWLTAGGDLSLLFMNSVGDIGLAGKGTSVGLRGLASADFRHFTTVQFPLIARLNLQYFFDNSANLVEGVEQARYEALPADRRVYADEDRQLLSRVERFALNINRVDMFNIGLGFESPLKAMENFYVHPLLEWRVGIPVNRQGYSCLYIPSDSGDGPAPGTDGCLDRQGLSSIPMNLTLGARVLPPVAGLSTFVAIDIGLSGTSTFVRELAGNAPYNVMLGVSYAYDLTPIPPDPVVREVERRVEVPAQLPIKGRVHGVVSEAGAATTRIAGAVVRFVGRDVTAQSTAADGTFTTYDFDPGDVAIELSHPEYNPGTCRATIPPAGGVVELACQLTALPRVGGVRGSLSNETGGFIAGATINLSGAASRSVQTDSSGNFNVADLPPGSYEARIEAPGHFPKAGSFNVTSRSTTNVNFTLISRPERSNVQLTSREIVIKKQINFATDSDVIDASSAQLIQEIADVLRTHPDIERVEIQGHTDNVGSADRNVDLSQRRAESVRRALIDSGIEGRRLEAKGYGSQRPLVPNITARNRARNRRVQFILGNTEAASGGSGRNPPLPRRRGR